MHRQKYKKIEYAAQNVCQVTCKLQLDRILNFL